ncbi:MAG: acyl-CoA dehydrogenase [Telmatospirillum sp.]|nr:acyl-CoA dehydrogenase [Telmatospirillum sp.]
MNFELDDEQKQLSKSIARFCETGLPERPKGTRYFTREQWESCGKAGLLGLSVPTVYGGGGYGALSSAVAMQAFGRHCPDMGLVFATCAHLFACVMPIVEFAGGEVKRRVLPRLASGQWIGSNAITEPDAGSDSAALKTVAVPTGDGYYRIDGFKSFAGNAPVADVIVTYATTEPSFGSLGVTGFVVETANGGLTTTEPLIKTGLASCPASGIRFEGCLVPEANRMGEEGQGRQIFQRSMGWERSCLFAAFLGMMERQIDRVVSHARDRRQFGKPIGSYQAVSHRITEMKLRLESARLLLYRACWGMDRGDDGQIDIALSKLAVSEGAVQSSIDAVRIFGGWGCLEESGIELMLRDSLGSVIFSGTSEMQREIVARELGL